METTHLQQMNKAQKRTAQRWTGWRGLQSRFRKIETPSGGMKATRREERNKERKKERKKESSHAPSTEGDTNSGEKNGEQQIS